MKTVLLALVITAMSAAAAQAQTRIFRCGNTYTNDAAEAQAKGCKPMEGGNITVVEGTRVNAPPRTAAGAAAPAAGSPTASAPAPRIDSADQRARDTDARQILEAELKKAEARQAELAKEYNNGEPERRGDERNYQKYLDRVADLKAAITRNDADIAGIKRELARLPAGR